MNRWIIAFFAMIVLASALGLEKISDRSEPPGRIHVAYWEKWTGFEYDAMKQIVDDFNKSQNRIYVDFLSTSQISTKTLFAVSAGCPPDVAGLWGDSTAYYADDRAVIPLDDLCRENGIKASDYIPAYWNMTKYHGHIWALPSTPTSTALNYNADLVRQLGYDPAKPPRTLEEFTERSDKMTLMKNGHLIRAGFLPSQPGNWGWGWGYMFGGTLWDGKKVVADTPENVRAYEWVQSFYMKYGPDEAKTFSNGFGSTTSPQNPFIEGKVVYELEGVWTHNTVHRYSHMKLGVYPWPYPADRPDLANLTFIGEDALFIPRGARHPKEAFEFIKFVQSQHEMEKLCVLHEKNSPLEKVSDYFWKNHENPDIRIYDRLPRGKNVIAQPQIGMWPEFAQEFDNMFDEISLLKITPREGLREFRDRIQPKLDQYFSRMKRREREGL